MSKREKSIVIIHCQPLEIYPPVTNCINFLAKEVGEGYRLHVITSEPESVKTLYANKRVDILRISNSKKARGAVGTVMRFAKFTIRALFKLIRLKPAAILYFESHSALPVFAYKRFFNKNARVFIHYHEYMSPDDYAQPGMRTINFAHSKEKYLFKTAEWISHTNNERMDLFLKDNPSLDKRRCHIMPNYPLREWAFIPDREKKIGQVCGLVYVGSFGSFEDLYIKEFLTWVKQNAGTIFLDIYSFKVPAHVVAFIEELGAKNIELKGAVNYDSLPSVLTNYNVGVIMYKATSLNVLHSEPNKLFEYLGCGLDVWFPEEMLGCYPYIHEETYPKVIKVNFKDIDNFDFKSAIKRDGLKERDIAFYCEDVVQPLAYKLLNVSGK
jgi:hypothetical protein